MNTLLGAEKKIYSETADDYHSDIFQKCISFFTTVFYARMRTDIGTDTIEDDIREMKYISFDNGDKKPW